MRLHSVRAFVSSTIFSGMLALGSLTSAKAQEFKVLYDATGGNAISNPASRVVTQGREGDMYFTAQNGGSFYGSLFKVSPAGAADIVNDIGYFVVSGATLGTDGNYYGTNQDGGPGGGCGFSGCGQIFKVTPAGVETIVYNFTGLGDGSGPQAAPIQATNGVFYGTTPAGGANGASTAYSVTSNGTFKTLHTFAESEGQQVQAELVQGTDGNFYGTAVNGGANGLGSVFKMTPAGAVTVLHSFAGSDGQNPCCGLVQDSNGIFYGSTAGGGGEGIAGVIFSITSAGVYTVLHSIDPAAGDGTGPGSTLTLGSDGKLYGVTASGTSGVSGTLFNITTSGSFTTLYTFCASGGFCTDGYGPSSPVKQNTNGMFYGVTSNGGDAGCSSQGLGCGTVYSLNMKLKPFISLVSTSGKEGANIGILGQGFTASSVVSFGGVQATVFSRSGSTFLLATVPVDALTGTVTVTTGETTLATVQPFRVTPTLISFDPSSGPVGTPVTITGTGFLQAAHVTFNGKAATFTVNSDTEITATVPSGATSGKILVTTKGGSVSSTSGFTVN